LICISTSGSSPNVVRASEVARRGELHVLALTGPGGLLPGLADVAIQVPGQNTQHIQEAHLAIAHIICGLVERRLYGSAAARPEETAARAAPAKERHRESR
jgi:D-sedoheptulose 7-phosphate isomerase